MTEGTRSVTHVRGLSCYPCTLLLTMGCSSPAGLGAQIERNTQSDLTARWANYSVGARVAQPRFSLAADIFLSVQEI